MHSHGDSLTTQTFTERIIDRLTKDFRKSTCSFFLKIFGLTLTV